MKLAALGRGKTKADGSTRHVIFAWSILAPCQDYGLLVKYYTNSPHRHSF